MDQKKLKAVRRFGRALEELKRVANRQGWALLPLTDTDGSPLKVYVVGRLEDIAVVQEIVHEVANAEG